MNLLWLVLDSIAELFEWWFQHESQYLHFLLEMILLNHFILTDKIIKALRCEVTSSCLHGQLVAEERSRFPITVVLSSLTCNFHDYRDLVWFAHHYISLWC